MKVGRKALCMYYLWSCFQVGWQGRGKACEKHPQGSDCDLVHLYGIISPKPRESIHLVQVLGRLGAGGGVALSWETRIVAQMPPLTSCLILNKLLCLPRLIFLICQVKWRLWNRWSLKTPSSSTVLFWVCLHLQTVMGGGFGEGTLGREANLVMGLNHFYLEQPCVLMGCVVQACLRLSK